MNSYRHAVSCARHWGGAPEDYIAVHEFIDGSKKVLGDVRHRALYHHTLGVWLCQEIFGTTLVIPKSPPGGPIKRTVRVPIREIAERHIIEDLGWLPTPADYMKNMPIEEWMSGARKRELPVSHILGTMSANKMTYEEAVAIIAPLAMLDREEYHQ